MFTLGRSLCLQINFDAILKIYASGRCCGWGSRTVKYVFLSVLFVNTLVSNGNGWH